MFHLAKKMNCLFRLEAICRSKAIQGTRNLPAGIKLFINVIRHYTEQNFQIAIDDFGHGYFMQKPDSMLKDPADEVKALICQCNCKVNTQRRDIYLWNEIGSIVHREQPDMTDKSGESIYSAFHHAPSLSEFCVISKDGHTEGLITRRSLKKENDLPVQVIPV